MTTLPTGNFIPERVAITCPLGVRFLDSATNAIVGDDLLIEAYPAAIRSAGLQPCRTAPVFWAFHGLPGLREFEYGTNDDKRWIPEPQKRPFVIEITDAQSRFLPSQFALIAPPGCCP